MDRTVRQVAVPDDARGLSTLPQIDYADAFVVETGPTRERTPEQWLRAILEDAPARTQRGLRLGWSLLGIRLGPSGSTRFVLGWEVRRSTSDHVLVRARSRTGVSAELLLRPAEETLLFDTFVHHENPVGRAVWTAIEARHVRVVRGLLKGLVRR